MSKTMKNGLPEQRYFTLESVAKEWKCDVEYILEQFDAGRLIPSIRLPELTGDWWQSTTNPIWVDDEFGWDWDGVVQRRNESMGSVDWYLPGYRFGPFRCDENGDRFLALEDCFLSKDRDGISGWFNPSGNIETQLQKVYLTALRLSKEEKERYIHKYNVHAESKSGAEKNETVPIQDVSKGSDTSFETKRLLTEKEAAAYIGMSRSFLKQGRYSGPVEGRTPAPPFVNMEGRAVRYLKEDLDKWIEQQPRRQSVHLEPLDDEGDEGK